MPFTLAHPAAILPIARVAKERLVFSALVIGSMAPDFEYLLQGEPRGRFSHSVPGLFEVCLPMGLAVFVAFQRFLKQPLISLFPDTVRSRLYPFAAPYPMNSVTAILAIAFSIVIGAATHIIWDSFTHLSGWPVRHFDVFRIPVFSVQGHDIRLFRVLQHGSSILGLSILAVAIARKLIRLPAQPAAPSIIELPQAFRRLSIWLLVLLPVTAGIIEGINKFPDKRGIRRWEVSGVHGALAGMSGLVVAIVVVASAYWLYVIQVRRKGKGPKGPKGLKKESLSVFH